MSVKDLETVNFLFTLLTIMLWNTILWHENQRFKHLIGMAIPLGLMALVKPSEILLVLVPLLWQTGTLEAIKDKWNKIKAAKWQILISILIVFVIALPQLFYWHTKTGLWIYDSYKNPGVGLDIFNPHIIESLFSYRKGWLVYTPVMIFFLAGFYFLFRSDKKLFTGLLIPFLVSFYVLSSWTEWWYGAGFSNRPVITYYPLLAIPFGFLLNELFRSGELIKGAVFMAFSFCMFLNLFQWWQMQHYILDPYRTTKDYYWATFLKTHVEEKDRDLLLVERSFSGVDTFKKEKAYSKKQLSYNNFNNDSPGVKIISPEMEFDLTNTIQYKELSSKDHVWLRFKFVYAFPDTTNSGKVIFCSTMDRKEGNYGYKTFEIDPQNAKNGSVQFDFLTPEIRDPKDLLKYYFWNRDHNKIYIDDFKVEVFEKK
jgi:hypothetical protein